jgi:TolB protein
MAHGARRIFLLGCGQPQARLLLARLVERSPIMPNQFQQPRLSGAQPCAPATRLLLGFVVWLSAMPLLLGGCIQPIQRPSATAMPPASADAAPSALAVANRLLVLGVDGNLFTVEPDGTGRFSLTSDAGARHFYAQPTWSPDGERVAWAEVNSETGAVSGALLTAAPDGSQLTRADVRFPPFFIYWSPDNERVAYLSNWLTSGAQTIALQLVDVAAGGVESSLLAMGQPFYFSWAPDGSQLLTHVAGQRIGLLGLDGAETLLSEQSAPFAAPQWSLDGRRLLYSTTDQGAPQLVVANREGAVEQVVTFFQSQVRSAFSLSPNGRYIAYTETEAEVSANSFGPLFLFDFENEQYEQLSTDPVIAFFWSPSGERLLYLQAEVAEGQLWFRLHVWDGKQTQQWQRFIPSGILLNQYLPFADQYAQNMRFWAPDSNAFVYAGQGEDGRRGIWVQSLDANTPVFVSEGLFATWSPR